MHLLCCKRWSLRYSPRWGNPHDCVVALYVGEGSERGQWHLLGSWQAFSHFLTSKLGPSGADSLGGWVCVHSSTLWVSPVDSPMKLGVSLTGATPTGVFSQRFWGFISPHWNPGLRSRSHSPVVPTNLSALECGTASHCLAMCPFCPGCPSPPLLPVWMTVSSLIPWLSDFHTLLFSGSSCYFLFLNLLSFFCFCREAKCIYLLLHLGWKSSSLSFFNSTVWLFWATKFW